MLSFDCYEHNRSVSLTMTAAHFAPSARGLRSRILPHLRETHAVARRRVQPASRSCTTAAVPAVFAPPAAEPEETHSSEIQHGQQLLDVSQQPEAVTPAPAEPMLLQPDVARRKKLWFAAIKPPMYSVAYVPILVAAAAAYNLTGIAAGSLTLQLMAASTLIIAWLNLSNDAYDADMGVDDDKPESVVNLTGNRTAVLLTAWACFAAGVGWLASLVASLGDTRVALMLSAAISMGYLYQGPPFRLSYKGLGEPLCFAAFGPLATCAFYLIQVAQPAGTAAALPAVSPTALCCSVAVGITITLVLFCSHFHQVAGDKAAGKMSPLVQLGTARGVQVLQDAVSGTYVLLALGMVAGSIPPATSCFLAATAPVAITFLRFAQQNHRQPARIKPLKLFALRMHMAVGAALVAGLTLPRLLTLA